MKTKYAIISINEKHNGEGLEKINVSEYIDNLQLEGYNIIDLRKQQIKK